MTQKSKNNLLLSVLATLIFIGFSIDATDSIIRGLAIGLFTTLCFLGFRINLQDDNHDETDIELNKTLIIFYLVFAIIFYFVIQYSYNMTNLNKECYENDNTEACSALEDVISN